MTISTPITGDLLYVEIEEDLRTSLRALLDKRCDWQSVLSRTESGDTSNRDLWHTLARDLGFAGIPVPEDLGGAGGAWREAAVVAEELGRAVAPIPFLGSAGIATALLLELGDTELLLDLASGASTVALAVPFATAPGVVVPTVDARDGHLHGAVHGVADVGAADTLLVPTEAGLYAVTTGAESVTVTESVSLDMTRPVADIVLEGAPGRLVASGGPALDGALVAALRVGAMLLASEQLGLAQRCLEMTVEYVKARRQFARLLGSYQALKHRLADLWVSITEARAVARYAAECVSIGSPDLPVAVALAQAVCSEVAQQAAEECIQLHGGIGFTWEHPAHLYLKRAKANAIGLGTVDQHRTALASLVELPGPATVAGAN